MNRTYFQALRWAKEQIAASDVDPHAPLFILQASHQWDNTHWLLHQREVMPDREWLWFQEAVMRLNHHEPAQYIVGQASFYGRLFRVNSSVLIPEPETADLVEWVLSAMPNHPLKVLDLGTGSGAIGITLALERPEWQLTLSDISGSALAVAQENAERLGAKVALVQSDLFDSLVDQRFDLIVTNPPYVDRSAQAMMDQSVIKYEPELALYADEHGLGFYHRLFQQINQHLLPGGHLFGETGFDQEQTIQTLFHQTNPGAKIKPRHDVADRMRMIHGWDFSVVGGN